jgi:hypothetical protein
MSLSDSRILLTVFKARASKVQTLKIKSKLLPADNGSVCLKVLLINWNSAGDKRSFYIRCLLSKVQNFRDLKI